MSLNLGPPEKNRWQEAAEHFMDPPAFGAADDQSLEEHGGE
jgi:hypothetical protein